MVCLCINTTVQEEWIELESKKFGMFWLNKSTGGIILQQDGAEVEAVSTSEGGERVGKRRKSKKKRVSVWLVKWLSSEVSSLQA